MAESAGAPVELTAPGRGQQSRLKSSNLSVFAGRREEKSSTTRVGKQALTRKGQAGTMRSAWPFSLYPASNTQPDRLNTWAVRFPPTGLPLPTPLPRVSRLSSNPPSLLPYRESGSHLNPYLPSFSSQRESRALFQPNPVRVCRNVPVGTSTCPPGTF